MSEYRVIGVEGLPEIHEGDDIAALISTAVELEDEDVVVVAQKVVSKAEGRVRQLDGVEPSRYAREISGDRDPRQTEVILSETARVVRLRPPLLIRTKARQPATLSIRLTPRGSCSVLSLCLVCKQVSRCSNQDSVEIVKL